MATLRHGNHGTQIARVGGLVGGAMDTSMRTHQTQRSKGQVKTSPSQPRLKRGSTSQR